MTPQTPNTIPLILAIVGAAEDLSAAAASTRSRVANAAVNAWMEGHLAAPGHPFDERYPGQAPDPPWPPSDSEDLTTIFQFCERFGPGEEAAAIVVAAGLGWQAGYRTGRNCDGCSPLGGNHPFAAAMRAGRGRVEISFHERDALSQTLFQKPPARELP